CAGTASATIGTIAIAATGKQAHAATSATPAHARRWWIAAPVAASNRPVTSDSGQITDSGANTGGNTTIAAAVTAATRGASRVRRTANSPNSARPLCAASIANGPAAMYSTRLHSWVITAG